MLIELFLLDELLLNLLIVRLAAALLSVRPPLFRQVGAALLSALAAAAAAYRFAWLTHPAFRPPLLALMALALPFKGWRGFARAMGAILFSTLVTGGAVCAFALLTRRIMARRVRAENAVTVVVLHKGVIRRFCGMADTGNSLTEPVSGLPVIVLRCRALKPYAKLPIPVVTAAGRGELRGFRPERLSVNGREVACFAAVTDESISAEAIVPPVLIGG